LPVVVATWIAALLSLFPVSGTMVSVAFADESKGDSQAADHVVWVPMRSVLPVNRMAACVPAAFAAEAAPLIASIAVTVLDALVCVATVKPAARSSAANPGDVLRFDAATGARGAAAAPPHNDTVTNALRVASLCLRVLDTWAADASLRPIVVGACSHAAPVPADAAGGATVASLRRRLADVALWVCSLDRKLFTESALDKDVTLYDVDEAVESLGAALAVSRCYLGPAVAVAAPVSASSAAGPLRWLVGVCA
jgi:hypothetical protein